MSLLPESAPGRQDAVIRWGGSLLLILTFVGLAAMSWRKWADPVIDFGIELYIPWRIVSGQHLYVDIAWKHGPLSQYLNALWFRLFGVSLTSLIYPNLLLLAGLTCLIRAYFHRVISPVAGITAAFVFLVLFGFSQYVPFGSNYTYVCPYRHEQTHGIICAVGAVYCLLRARGEKHIGWLFVTGIAMGLIALTKIELLVAILAAVGFGFAISRWLEKELRTGLVRQIAALGGGLFIPPIVAFGLLATRMPAGTALKGTSGNLAYLFSTNLSGQAFYLGVSGFDTVDRNVALLLLQFMILGGIVVAAAFAEFIVWRLERGRFAVAVGMAAIFGLAAYRWVEWFELSRAFPLILFFLTLKTTIECFRIGDNPELRGRVVGLATWMVFALAMLAKMILATRISHYGFTLAMPATLVILLYVLYIVPARLHQGKSKTGPVFQWAITGVTVAGLCFFFNISRTLYSYKHFSIGEGGDRMVFFDPKYSRIPVTMAESIKGIRNLIPPGETLAVMPEGAILNYLTRHPSSVPYTSYIPYDLATFGGEAATLETLKRHRPEYIAFVHRDLREYGVGWFGTDPKNGKLIMDWVVKDYRAIHLAGALPLQREAFGILLVQRRDLPPPPGIPVDKK